MGINNSEISKISNYDEWFVNEISDLVHTEKIIAKSNLTQELYIKAKTEGFSDEKILELNKGNSKRFITLKKKK